MTKNISNIKANQGFTLVELIVVIILLGILAAVAIPRFLDAGVDARQAALSGLSAGIKTGRESAIARYRLDGASGATTITLDGTSVDVLSGGNPEGDSGGIEAALKDFEGFSVSHAAGVSTFTITGYSGANCEVEYTAATGAVVVTDTGC